MQRMISIDPLNPAPADLSRAAKLLHQGFLVAYPTETFYGLGAEPMNPDAVERIFEAKGRPQKMALPLIAGDKEGVLQCTREFPETAERLAAAFWPGPLTLVLPASSHLPSRLLGGGATVGVRISPNPIAVALARAVGGPLIATSANRSGQPAPTTADEVEQALGEEVALILNGGPTQGIAASTVLDLTCDPPRVIRSGVVPISALEKLLGRRFD